LATHHASPGEIVDLNTWTKDLPNEHTKAVVKTDKMELIRLVIPIGKEIPTHKVSGLIIVHCIKGEIEFIAMNSKKKLMPGQLLYLMPHEAHSVKASEDSVVLLVIIF
jgi:quercetin dioxygenase-like cupin family protein